MHRDGTPKLVHSLATPSHSRATVNACFSTPIHLPWLASHAIVLFIDRKVKYARKRHYVFPGRYSSRTAGAYRLHLSGFLGKVLGQKLAFHLAMSVQVRTSVMTWCSAMACGLLSEIMIDHKVKTPHLQSCIRYWWWLETIFIPACLTSTDAAVSIISRIAIIQACSPTRLCKPHPQ
jgi:hypothetical protein